MKELKRKLASRKLWLAIAGFVAGLILAFGGTQEAADTTTGCIMSGASVIAYVLAEGFADGKSAVQKKGDEHDEG